MGGEPVEIDAMKDRARRSGTAGRCVFAGKRTPETLPLFLGLSSVLVSPRSRGTNTPFKLYTYMASGKPIVATRIPTHTQLLEDRVAWLVDLSAKGLAAGIRDALANRDEAAARAARARELVDREYSATRYVEKVSRAYQSISSASTR